MSNPIISQSSATQSLSDIVIPEIPPEIIPRLLAKICKTPNLDAKTRSDLLSKILSPSQRHAMSRTWSTADQVIELNSSIGELTFSPASSAAVAPSFSDKSPTASVSRSEDKQLSRDPTLKLHGCDRLLYDIRIAAQWTEALGLRSQIISLLSRVTALQLLLVHGTSRPGNHNADEVQNTIVEMQDEALKLLEKLSRTVQQIRNVVESACELTLDRSNGVQASEIPREDLIGSIRRCDDYDDFLRATREQLYEEEALAYLDVYRRLCRHRCEIPNARSPCPPSPSRFAGRRSSVLQGGLAIYQLEKEQGRKASNTHSVASTVLVSGDWYMGIAGSPGQET